MAETKRKLGPWTWVAIGMAATLTLLVLLGVGLRYWITSDGGRSFLVSQIDGRKLGPLGVIRVSGLKGDPLEAASVADIAFVDDDGVWMRARGAEVKWTPFRLLRGDLEIQSAHVRQIEVLRRPRATYESSGRPGPNIGLNLEEVVIDELKIAGGVFGTAATYRVDGSVARGRDGAGAFRLGVGPLSGPGDRIDANAQWSVDGDVNGEANALGPANGVLAGLLQAPADTPVSLIGSIGGRIESFDAALGVRIGEIDRVRLNAKRRDNDAEADLRISGADWPLLAEIVERTGPEITLTSAADLSAMNAAPVQLTLVADIGRLEAAGVANLDEMRLPETIDLKVAGLDLARLADDLAGKLDAGGQARFASLLDWSWQGDVTASDFAVPGVAARQIAGPISAGGRGAAISWRADALNAQGARIDALETLAPADYTIGVRGSLNFATSTVEITQSQIRGGPGEATARGQYQIATGAFDFAGAASIASLQSFSPVSGAARGQWRVRRTGPTAPLRISADVAGRNASSANEALAALLGAAPRVRVEAVVQDGRVLVESGDVETAALNANVSGRIEENGAVNVRAQGRLIRPLAISGVTLRSLSANAQITGQTTAPRVSLTIADGAATLPGMPLDDLSGSAVLMLGDTPSGQFALSGKTEGQPVRLAGRLADVRGDLALADLNLTLGGLVAKAPQLVFAGGGARSSFTIAGDLAGLAGVERGAVDARGAFAVGDATTFDLNGRITGLRRGGLAVDLLAFEGEGNSDSAKVSGRIDGDFGARTTLAYALTAAAADAGGWGGGLTLAGEFDNSPVATTQPVAWTWNEGEWSVAGGLSALGGELVVDAAQTSEAARSTLTVQRVDVRALTRFARINPMEGRISGRSEFVNPVDGPAVADFSVAIADANPVGVTADPVSFDLQSRLRDGRLVLEAKGQGQGFSLSAEGAAAVREGEGFNVMLDTAAPVSARMRAQGRADQLWTIFGPEGQTLRGQIDADVQVSGLIGEPDLSGRMTLADGVFEHADTGLRLTRMIAEAELQQNTLRLTRFTAADANGGSLTADGSINWGSEIDGGIRFTASNLRALGRDDRFAVLSGSGSVDLDADAVRVEGAFEVQQARFSIEQPAAASIPVLPGLRRVNFVSAQAEEQAAAPERFRPVRLDLSIAADRRIFVTGRGVDSEWSADIRVRGTANAPLIEGSADLVRGGLDLASRRFELDSGSIRLSGPINTARVDISATRDAADIDATVRVTGTPDDLKFELTSTPALPQDEVLSRVLFGRSASQLSALEAAQLAAGLTQLAGGQAAFDPAGLIRDATGLDRVTFGANESGATVAAGKYLAEDVYVQVGTGGQGGVGAEVEWQPLDNVSIISSAQGNGDTRIAVRWKRDY